MAEKKQSRLSLKQINNISRFIDGILVIASFWLAISNQNQANVLLALVLLLAYGFVDTHFLFDKAQKHIRRWSYGWLVSSASLVAFLITHFYTINLNSDTEYRSLPEILITISVIAIVAKLILILGVKKTSLKMEFFKTESVWIIILVSGITILISEFYLLDLALAVGILIHVLVQNLIVLEETSIFEKSTIAPKKELPTQELDQEIIDQLLEIPRVEKIYDLKIISPDDKQTVIGSLVVDNHSTQEDIYKIKQKAKKILKENKLTDSVLETEYLAEFNQREEFSPDLEESEE